MPAGQQNDTLRINCAGGVFMCRKTVLHGWCLVMLGLGLMLGHSIESWMACTVGGLVLVCLGFFTVRKK